VTSFIGIGNVSELSGFCIFLKNEDKPASNFFQGLGKNTCSLQLALKITAQNTVPGL